jgi:hypothetical protein
MEHFAMGCLCLASKIEEAPRRVRDVINVFNHIKQVDSGKWVSYHLLRAPGELIFFAAVLISENDLSQNVCDEIIILEQMQGGDFNSSPMPNFDTFLIIVYT